MGLEPYSPYGGGSRASRDAVRRSFERGVRSIFVRLRRAGLTFVGLLTAFVLYLLTIGFPGWLAFFLVFPTILLLSLVVMAFPVRDKRREQALGDGPIIEGSTNVRLDRLASQTEDWLLERARALPSQAAGSLDRIIDRLRDLQAPLAGIKPESSTGGEAQRLIGQHLPSLVTTYLALPPGDRGFHDNSSAVLADSLGIVADRLDELCERVAHEKRLGFETERRFIETRYSEDERLRSGN